MCLQGQKGKKRAGREGGEGLTAFSLVSLFIARDILFSLSLSRSLSLYRSKHQANRMLQEPGRPEWPEGNKEENCWSESQSSSL